METIAKADIFFVVTTVAIVAVSIALLAVLVYTLLILRDVKNISRKVKEETQHISEDIKDLRTNIRTEGAKIRHFTTFAKNIYYAKRGARKRAVSLTASERRRNKGYNTTPIRGGEE